MPRISEPHLATNVQLASTGSSRKLLDPESRESQVRDASVAVLDTSSGSDSESRESHSRQPHAQALRALFVTKMNVLLLALPLALIAKVFSWPEEWIFIFSMVALVPLAERVSFVTEDIAKNTNSTIGGLLNATFGNITELIVCIFALKAGLLRVVQVSMLGSVLSNLLLVLGSAFFVGGIKHRPEQTFNKTAAETYSSLLIAAVLGLSMPSLLDACHSGSQGPIVQIVTGGGQNHSQPVEPLDPRGHIVDTWMTSNGTLEEETMAGGDAPLWLSRVIAVCLLFLYFGLLLFQLKTHTSMFEDDDDDEDEPSILGLGGGCFWLATMTIFISLLSEWIVDAIEGAAKGLHIPILFLSGILIPIVGNAAEHAGAIIFAWKNKMAISLGCAIGSAVQISVFVIPLCVLLGWAMGRPMSLNFHVFETAVLLLACIGAHLVTVNGNSNWLKGVTLIFCYCIIAAAFWAHADPLKMS